MLPTEIVNRARDAALIDASRVETRLTMGSVDAALRSLLADLREGSQFGGHTDAVLPGWESARPVIDALLREIGEGRAL